MTDPQRPGGPDDEQMKRLFEQLGLGEDTDLNTLLEKVQQMLGQMGGVGAFGPGGPFGGGAGTATLNWETVRQVTRQMSAASGPDPSPTPQQQRQVADAARLAELWLDQNCEFPEVTQPAQVWSRAEWIEQTVASWQPVVEPIINSLADAMHHMMNRNSEELPTDDPLQAFTHMLSPVLRQMAGSMYQLQFAQALAATSRRVVSGSDVGFQLLPQPRVTLLEDNVQREFGELDLPMDDVRLYLTLREAARQRLFAHVGWLGPQLLAYVEHYARETRIDEAAVEEVFDPGDFQSLSPERLGELSQQLQGKLFEPTRTPEQVEVLERLETLLALTEGWVDVVVDRAAKQWMPNHAALSETIRRRRGTGGPVEEIFEQLVGLELRPRRVRDAANLWAAVGDMRGQVARDQLWSHPDMLPTAAALDDPIGFATQLGADSNEPDDLDRELAALLDQEKPEQE